MRLPRLTTRRLMVLVAVVAVAIALGVESWKRRRQAELYAVESYLRGDAAKQAAILASVDKLLAAADPADLARREKCQRLVDEQRQRLQEARRRLEHAAALRRAYERAARYPWLPLSPDPP